MEESAVSKEVVVVKRQMTVSRRHVTHNLDALVPSAVSKEGVVWKAL